MRRIFFAILLLIIAGCSEEDKMIQAPFTGKWKMIEVTIDHVLQTEWRNLELAFQQDNSEGGKYQTTNTVNDSVWNDLGTWTAANDPSRFIRDDSITVTYHLRNDTLFMMKVLPWTVVPCVPTVSDPCPLAVTGVWHFVLVKE
ncbi:hypothetical protein QQ020_13620 [Fulvivirgaceae bacterium BMA12]|uniref:Lipocalin-like domain-containing protein n=1 Tax=Agaribacillus aureus TaxID=3051825 RepID=A0ABT8L5S6_9BACT|nr:hypothetical protein [Fulvivirgaceae bacterium BMA12]